MEARKIMTTEKINEMFNRYKNEEMFKDYKDFQLGQNVAYFFFMLDGFRTRLTLSEACEIVSKAINVSFTWQTK